MAKGYLTTHILDTANGCPADGVAITLYKLEGENRRELGRHVTNDDGRTDTPLIPAGELEAGRYELLFEIGAYFAGKGSAGEGGNRDNAFLDSVPIRFGIDKPDEHYHVPLLASPFSFSTYRGS